MNRPRCRPSLTLCRLADVEPICTHLQQILQRKAACQVDGDEEEAALAAGDQSEYDAALISSAMDLVGTLASVLGADFAQLMPMFQNDMAQYYVRPLHRSTTGGNGSPALDDGRTSSARAATDQPRSGPWPRLSTGWSLP